MTFARTLAFCAASLAPLPAAAMDDIVTASILPGWRGADGTHTAALKIVLAPGWKTYWRVPGEGGIPPIFDWGASQNLADVAVSWPVPTVFRINGMRSVGYAGQVILPLSLTAQDPGAPIVLDARVDIGVCEDVCVPMALDLRGTLNPGTAPRDPAIAAALADRPLARDEAAVGAVTCDFEPIADGLRVTAAVEMPRLARGEEVVIEAADPMIWVSEPTSKRRGGMLVSTADLVPPEARPFAIDRSGMRITVIAAGQAVEIDGCG